MKALLLRVGIDKGSGGCLAPIFRDGSFEYIPIPEGRRTKEGNTYGRLIGRNYEALSNFLPKRLLNQKPHIDPEFKTFTYGDPTHKRRQLKKLKPGDLLVFYAGLEPDPRYKMDTPRLFIIGYFTVKSIYDFRVIPKWKRRAMFRRLRNNAHAKRHQFDKDLLIVEGDSRKSQLLTKALPIGDAEGNILPDLKPITDYEGSLQRAIGHEIDQDHIEKFKKFLNSGVPALENDDTNLFSYVLKTDSGFAPNVTGGYCTLACCKPKIRKLVEAGNWVIGTLPKRFGPNRLAYVMRVNETMNFDEYFRDNRFEIKKLSNGDNIYYKKNNRLKQVQNRHHQEKDMHHDTKVDRVLISSLFWYFGDQAPEIPNEFRSLIKKGPAHKNENDSKLIRDFVSWVSSNYRPGLHGYPRDRKGDKDALAVKVTGAC